MREIIERGEVRAGESSGRRTVSQNSEEHNVSWRALEDLPNDGDEGDGRQQAGN